MSSDGESTVVRMSQNNRRILVRRTLIAALILVCSASAYSIFLVVRFHTNVAVFQRYGAYLESASLSKQGEIVRVEYDKTSGPAFIPAPFIRYHRSLFAIYLRHVPQSNPDEINELFDLLQSFPKLEQLYLESFAIDQNRAIAIAQLPKLKVLRLTDCQIEKSALASALHSTGLTHLNLADSKFHEAELEALNNGPTKETLVGLGLSNCKITDQSASIISRLRNLETLVLDGTQITDQSLKILARLPKLKVLILDHTKVTDAGVAYLSSAPHLVELSLSNTSVSDAMLETLKQEIPALRVSDD
ncbi:Leucine Rich repeats (2 copies) [Gimesia alba]|uniref:Leucine Rich repeats (2 copies) n=1 Tax=Gimesia alba TaxID=2527973 RepID=A0A517RN04_9PLAN|nr:hypothetical protein [Gimesia alba]QDT45260.1 Leucine Rich repeats (2 copies) [Gimesia alba]